LRSLRLPEWALVAGVLALGLAVRLPLAPIDFGRTNDLTVYAFRATGAHREEVGAATQNRPCAKLYAAAMITMPAKTSTAPAVRGAPKDSPRKRQPTSAARTTLTSRTAPA
jgi:hypothetical protein